MPAGDEDHGLRLAAAAAQVKVKLKPGNNDVDDGLVTAQPRNTLRIQTQKLVYGTSSICVNISLLIYLVKPKNQ